MRNDLQGLFHQQPTRTTQIARVDTAFEKKTAEQSNNELRENIRNPSAAFLFIFHFEIAFGSSLRLRIAPAIKAIQNVAVR